jgi:hypothetical protein
MKMRILTSVASGMLLLTIIVGCSGSDATAKKGKSTKRGHVIITKTGSEMGPVEFFHRKHKKHAMDGEKCKTCHHVGRWGQSCGEPGCHNDPEKDEGAARIHITCLERCHAATEDKAPTDCSDARCHQSME